MVTAAEKVMVRYVCANLADKMELALDDLTRSRFLLDFEILHGLLDRVSKKTRISNPEISQQAGALSQVFFNAHDYLKDEVLEALGETRELVKDAIF